jgi:DNA-binding transcriptional LysR family regulator
MISWQYGIRVNTIFFYLIYRYHKKTLEFNSVAAIIACVQQGLGLTLIPRVAVSHEINTKKLIALPWSDGDFEVAQLMIWHQDK